MMERFTKILIGIGFAIFIILLISLITWVANKHMNHMESRANDLSCVWDFGDYCYKENPSGELSRYKMKYLGGKYQLVRD